MKVYLVTFAEGTIYENSQRQLKYSLNIANIDEHIYWNHKKIKETQFYNLHKELLDKQPGFGYWAWKPYIILDQLQIIGDDDILIYMDASRYETDGFKNSCLDVIKFMKDNNIDILPGFKTGNTNRQMIKQSCLEYFKLDKCNAFLNLSNIFTSPMFIRKTDFTISFIKQWLNGCLIESNISHEDLRSYGGICHIYDQAVLNCLLYKYTIVSFKPDTTNESEFRKFTYYFNYFKVLIS